MTVANILVVGAAGQTGKHILKALLGDKSAKWTVRAAIFEQEQEEQEKSLSKFEGLEKVTLNPYNPESLVQAMRDTDELVLIPPPLAEKKLILHNCIKAAHQARTKFVLLVSQYGAEEPEFVFGQQFRDLEEMFKTEAELRSYCILRPQYYVQNLLLLRDLVKKGELPIPIGSGRFAPVDADDVGEATCKILQEPSKHVGKVYSLTGPEAMSTEEIAKKLSKLTGQEVKPLDDPTKAKSHLKQAIPPAELLGVLELYQVIAQGKLNDVSPDAESLLGHKGTSFETWAKEHVDFFK
jgi:uncharacterized protein YbjT (DUF2867 family)